MRAAQNGQHLHPTQPPKKPRPAFEAGSAVSRPNTFKKRCPSYRSSAMGALGSQNTSALQAETRTSLLTGGRQARNPSTPTFSFKLFPIPPTGWWRLTTTKLIEIKATLSRRKYRIMNTSLQRMGPGWKTSWGTTRGLSANRNPSPVSAPAIPPDQTLTTHLRPVTSTLFCANGLVPTSIPNNSSNAKLRANATAASPSNDQTSNPQDVEPFFLESAAIDTPSKPMCSSSNWRRARECTTEQNPQSRLSERSS